MAYRITVDTGGTFTDVVMLGLQLEALKALSHVQMYETPTAETAIVRGKATREPFTDPRVRKALRLCINQQEILDLSLRGLGLQAEHHHVSPIHPEYAKLPFMGQDIAQAKKLLAEAGHPDGLDLEIGVNNGISWQVNAAQGMVEQWKLADVRVKMNIMPGTQFWENWDKVSFGYTLWYHRPLGVMCLALAYRSGVPWNEAEYSNPEFDRLLTQAEGTLDVDARREIMAEVEKIMQEDGPIMQPVWRSNFTFMDKRVKGFQLHPTNYVFPDELAIET